MKASPIYCVIDNPARKSDCSFGARGRFTQDVRVGTSASNSHSLGRITVEQYPDPDTGRMAFSMWLDGQLVRKGSLDGHEFTMEVSR